MGAPRFCETRAMVLGQVVNFCQILVALENSVEAAYKSHC